jgi:hypothetical protein
MPTYNIPTLMKNAILDSKSSEDVVEHMTKRIGVSVIGSGYLRVSSVSQIILHLLKTSAKKGVSNG